MPTPSCLSSGLALICTGVRRPPPTASRCSGPVDILSTAAETDPADVFAVSQKAIASSLKLIMRADDSDGIMGDAIRALLDLHADTAAPAGISPTALVTWMINSQFENECDFFTIDPVGYAPPLGDKGIARYRAQLEEIRDTLGPVSGFNHSKSALEYNDRRLAVLDRDVDAIIRTHCRNPEIAAWLQETANALAEIGEYSLAIDWARRATFLGLGFQSERAAQTWCDLLAAHRADELLAARTEVFRRWPSAKTAEQLHADAGNDWPTVRDDVTAALAASPADAVSFTLDVIGDPRAAWEQAHDLPLTDIDVWLDLIKKYEKIDRLAVLAPLRQIVDAELEHAKARHYKTVARRIKHMRTLARGSDRAADIDAFIAELRTRHNRRKRLLAEFDRAGLP
ncbi:hypothetical protein [Gordonia rubripertincta]|uniref:Uncharacterized protein n=1 Tax=Gordonia rubripertincta TaxID=36822 RepID=A0ABT4MYW1_GORRU|nr:hypothetical protein [Gordonia rubripertincta]MCZ4552195.1 hypothetical protein [Gordonia rubripertincta]